MPDAGPISRIAAILALLALLGASAWSAPVDQCVQLMVTTQTAPPQITLSWQAASATSYDVYRRAPSASSWGSAVASLGGSATSWTDTGVSVGSAYEYRVLRDGGSAWGYVLAGIDAATQPDSRGKLVLLVDATIIPDISSDLAQLRKDLVADGWTVLEHDLARTTTVPNVRATIVADYNADPTRVKAVYLLGHLAQPYSGDTAFDGHYPQHSGAWPADIVYADMNGSYTDSSVNDSSSGDARITNVPGDGKYDQSYATGSAFVAVGRVDFIGQWQYMDELAAMRAYLQRAHAFRTRVWTAQQKAVAIDGFGDYAPAVAMALRGFPPLVGAANLTSGGDAIGVAPHDWWPTMNDASLAGNPYIWAYESGPGYGQGIINSHVSSYDFLDGSSHPSHAVFTAFFGSYFGDWGYTPSLLMAPLWNPGGEGLACFWGGWPGWPVHLMGLGRSIGDVTYATVARNGEYNESSSAPIHVALMGDPTLRLHPMRPPTGVGASASAGAATITWSTSVDAGLGYHVFRAASASGPFTRLTSSPVGSTTYHDSVPAGGTFTYLVKAVHRESTPSGSYINLSLGAFSGSVTIPPGGGTTTSGTTTSGTTTSGSTTSGTTTTSGTSTSGTASSGGASASGGSGGPANPGGGSSKSGCGLGSGFGLGLIALLFAFRRRR